MSILKDLDKIKGRKNKIMEGYRKERVFQFFMRAFNKKRKPKHTTSFKFSKNKFPLLIIGYSKYTKRNVKFRRNPNGEDGYYNYIFPRYWNSNKIIFCYSTIGKV